jgi:cytochrome c biogenesis protein CcmG/thiol:disulfide interchange protein DsbE
LTTPPDRATEDGGATVPASTTDPTPARARPAPPRRLRAFLIGVVLAAVLAVALFVGLGSTSTTGSGTGGVVAVGSIAPNFMLASVVGGAPVELDALGAKRHRPVVLNFYASWCVPCQKETPLLATTASAEQAKGSVIQFIGVDGEDLPSNAIPFIRQSGITYPVGQDSDLRVTAGIYGLNGEPQTFFIDESGIVVGHHLGALDKAELDSWVHRLAGRH